MKTRRITMPALYIALLAIVGAVLVAPGSSAAEPGSAWRYTMVAFSGASDRDMDVYESPDGTEFTLLKKAAYRPPSGRVRDPSIFRNTDGTNFLAYTTADGANIGFARSADRINWTFMHNYPVPFCCAFLPGTGDGTGSASPPGFTGSAGFSDGPSLSPFTTKAWAPEWFVENGRIHVILSMSTGGGFIPYLMTALDSSMRHWGPPVPIAGIGADHIDTTIVKIGSTYHAITKNETKKTIQHAVSQSLLGPYSFVTPGNWGTMVEGPAVVQLPNGNWRLFLDAYTKGTYHRSDSADGMTTWSPLAEEPKLSGKVRHIGIMREAA